MPKVSEDYRDSRRQEILSAARRVFLRNGFHATSMQDLFTEAQLSSGSVYRYFTGKEDVILAIAEETIAEVASTIATTSAVRPGSSVGAALAAGIALIHDRNSENGLAGIGVQVWSEALRNPRVKAGFTAMVDELRCAVAALVERHQHAGSLPGTPAAASLATLMISIFMGYIVQLAILGDEAVDDLPQTLQTLWPEAPSAG